MSATQLIRELEDTLRDYQAAYAKYKDTIQVVMQQKDTVIQELLAEVKKLRVERNKLAAMVVKLNGENADLRAGLLDDCDVRPSNVDPGKGSIITDETWNGPVEGKKKEE